MRNDTYYKNKAKPRRRRRLFSSTSPSARWGRGDSLAREASPVHDLPFRYDSSEGGEAVASQKLVGILESLVPIFKVSSVSSLELNGSCHSSDVFL